MYTFKPKRFIVVTGMCVMSFVCGYHLNDYHPEPAVFSTQISNHTLSIAELPKIPIPVPQLHIAPQPTTDPFDGIPTSFANHLLPEEASVEPVTAPSTDSTTFSAATRNMDNMPQAFVTPAPSDPVAITATEPAAAPAPIQTAKLKEVAQDTAMHMLISDLTLLNQPAYDLSDEGHIYWQATVTLQNVSDQLIDYSPYDFFLETETGEVYNYALNMASPTHALQSGALTPNGTAYGTVCFEIPDDAVPKYIGYTSSYPEVSLLTNVTQTVETPMTIERPVIPYTVERTASKTVKVKSTEATLLNVAKVTETNHFTYPREGMEFVRLYVSLTNLGLEACDYNSNTFKLLDQYGNLSDYYVSGLVGDNPLRMGKIMPNETVSGTILFERPIDQDTVLVYQPDMFDQSSLGMLPLNK